MKVVSNCDENAWQTDFIGKAGYARSMELLGGISKDALYRQPSYSIFMVKASVRHHHTIQRQVFSCLEISLQVLDNLYCSHDGEPRRRRHATAYRYRWGGRHGDWTYSRVSPSFENLSSKNCLSEDLPKFARDQLQEALQVWRHLYSGLCWKMLRWPGSCFAARTLTLNGLDTPSITSQGSPRNLAYRRNR